MYLNIALFVLLITSLLLFADGKKVLSCYVMFWSAYRVREGKFSMELIEPNLCTHIIYSYNGIKSVTQEIIPLDPSADFTPGQGNIEKLISLKDENPELKIMVSLGGWSEGSKLLSDMVQSNQNRTAFINNAIKFIKTNSLDGIDFDWQHPTQNGGKDEDKKNFPTLLEELRKAFDEYGYILSVRLVGMRHYIDPGYDLARISEAVHFINLRTFGYHGDWESKTGIHAPLTSDDEANVGFSLRYMVKKGADPQKLLLGIRTGGSAVLMEGSGSSQDKPDSYLGAKTKGKFAGTLTQQKGFFGYIDYCWETYLKQPWKVFWHSASSTPYAVLGKKFISFDNKESIAAKLDLVTSKDLGGVTIYSIDTDDFKGLCDNVTFPVTKQARDFLLGRLSPPPYITFVVNHNYPERR